MIEGVEDDVSQNSRSHLAIERWHNRYSYKDSESLVHPKKSSMLAGNLFVTSLVIPS